MSKPNFNFDGLLWIPLYFCVYEMMLVLLKLNGKMLVKWLSEQFWRCCLCIYVLIETADDEINMYTKPRHSFINRDSQNMRFVSESTFVA